MTIRQLLNHTSNLPNYTMNIDGYTTGRAWTAQQLVDGALRKRQPNAQPGEKWEYTNTNYVLAGMIIRAVTGNEPAVEMKTRIFDRLGLADTTLPTTDNNLYGYFSFHLTSEDGAKQVVEANNESHLISGTPGQNHTGAAAANAFCAL
ncbi:serine hydrolase domain-containing protein [Streptomyces sp. NPDC056943]|uniref:serine hydrolase domain-containing protein n=1 Tax=Streptomyces sp. NPDC056943 TaxID=3345971 RepID=UPI0036252C83